MYVKKLEISGRLGNWNLIQACKYYIFYNGINITVQQGWLLVIYEKRVEIQMTCMTRKYIEPKVY